MRELRFNSPRYMKIEPKPDERLLTREHAVLLVYCSGKEYTTDEREDIIRYLISGAEAQLAKDLEWEAKREALSLTLPISGFIFINKSELETLKAKILE